MNTQLCRERPLYYPTLYCRFRFRQRSEIRFCTLAKKAG